MTDGSNPFCSDPCGIEQPLLEPQAGVLDVGIQHHVDTDSLRFEAAEGLSRLGSCWGTRPQALVLLW
eukprot:3830071-Amphidinium_carterae.1